jgi:hypothetical protein
MPRASLNIAAIGQWFNLYDRRSRNWRAFLVEPLYPVFFWLISAGATLRSQTIGLIRGPRSSRVVWDVPREDM